MRSGLRGKDVFINCPFDNSYRTIFDAIVFTVRDLGFIARCALEIDDASEVRLRNITRMIVQCAYGVHDISAVRLGVRTNLPRFNMPLELGLYLGCKFFGGPTQQHKACLILDSDPYRYRASISDISGQDIHSHDGRPETAITEVRNWLANVSKTKGLPGGARIAARYRNFLQVLPRICRRLKRRPEDLTFFDFIEMIEIWLDAAR